MDIDFFLNKFECNSIEDWIVWNSKVYKYKDLIQEIDKSNAYIKENNIFSGQVVGIVGDFTPESIALLLSLISNNNIIVPFTTPLKENDLNKLDIAQVRYLIHVDINTGNYSLQERKTEANPLYYQTLRKTNSPGLVLFTSGTSGTPKAAVHNFEKLLKKFEYSRKTLRTINFLLFDHWGGLNTLFNTLSNAGLVIPVRDRNPEKVCSAVENFKIELLPVSPSFLNLLLISEAYQKYDLTSLKLITYGTEPMPESTLAKARSIFPEVKFQQTYGLIELGVLRSKSKEDGSLWVKLGGEGYELRVVENLLEIKAESAMIGYLNAPSPFTDDGFFKTGDMVEQDGDYYKILGRKSELINVGGEKVYPQEVENFLLQYPGVKDVTVFGEKNPIMGNIVCAKIYMQDFENEKTMASEIKRYCRGKLASFKVPVKIFIQNQPLFNERYKKQRS